MKKDRKRARGLRKLNRKKVEEKEKSEGRQTGKGNQREEKWVRFEGNERNGRERSRKGRGEKETGRDGKGMRKK